MVKKMAPGSEIANFLTGQDALILFYGVYFTLIMNIIRKYRTFDLQLLFSKDKNRKKRYIRRFIMGFLIIDVLAVMWLLVLFTFIIPPIVDLFPLWLQYLPHYQY